MRARAAALALVVLAGCTGSQPKASVKAAAPEPSPTPTPTLFVSPLTGVEVPALQNRPALAVKIENELPARPQSGLQFADIVYEEEIEGGDTRFMAIFQSQDAPNLGPVRSARMVDPDILVEYNALFTYSGGAKVVLAHVRQSGLFTMTEDTPRATHRINERHAPHNLYTSTQDLYAAAAAKITLGGPPKQFFQYDDPAPAAVATPTPTPERDGDAPPRATASVLGSAPQKLRVEFSGAQVATFDYDAATKTYLRSQGYSRHLKPHLLADGTQVSARNVIVMFIHTKEGFHRDAAGHHTPDGVVTGGGRAFLLRDGVLLQGRWSRPTLSDPTVFTDLAGYVFKLAPGNTWIELAPPHAPVSVT